jgi:tetratricopeptide (TPR) repeat protein
MKTALPHGKSHGWGVAGSYLAAEIAQLPAVDGVTLHSIAGLQFAPSFAECWDRINIGYCFFEHEIPVYNSLLHPSHTWDCIVAGSSWCEHHLRIAGCESTTTILQGVDSVMFRVVPERDDDGRFIVFSGGKFEFRKSHDIVIAAMNIFMTRHQDVWLACAWHNQWPFSVRTMGQSSLIRFQYHEASCETIFRETLANNGIDPDRVIMYPRMDNTLMQQAYVNSDVGLFPNRCEGGNNMVMCEYMACGRPVIASTLTGHADVITADNALCLTAYEPILARCGTDISGVWFEPKMEEVLELLEQAYQNRSLLRAKAKVAGNDMLRLTWPAAARKFHDIAGVLASKSRQSQELPHTLASQDNAQSRADALFENGRYDESEQLYCELLRKRPFDPTLHNSLATVLDRCGRYREAVAHYLKALSLCEAFTEARFNMANTLKRLGDSKGAIESLQQVVASNPLFVEAWENLALCHLDEQNLSEAAQSLERAVTLAPDRKKNRADLGRIYTEMCRYAEAIACFDELLQDSPDDVLGLLNSKGIALQEMGDGDAAEICYMGVLNEDPANIEALNNLGTLRRDNLLPHLAIDYFEQALLLEPGDDQLIFNRSVSRLTTGNYKQGWLDYEKRFSSGRAVGLCHQEFSRWDGAPLNGKSLLVQSEQGFGDTLQFVRYLPLLRNYCGRVIFQCQSSAIKAVLHGVGGVDELLVRGETLPHVDYQIPLLSLPLIFGTELDSIPCAGGYLKADPGRVDAWRERLISCHKGMLIGINWAGRKTRLNGNRAMHLEALRSLLDLDECRFVSLQRDEEAGEAKAFSDRLLDLNSEIKDFGDTAAIMMNLDLIITIDSAVAHLAGALGAPVWVLLKYAPDWRWLLERTDSPWYTSMKLFRQQRRGEWHDVVREIVHQLQCITMTQK